ncbi:MAG: hypothetical protein J5733_09955 [Bacteroidaceae bacterium]|nr:hypothetical protein [Bacteroidaceae bacterium]
MRTFEDTDIREALQRKFADTPQVPSDLNERLLQRIQKEEDTALKHRILPIALRWIAVAAVLVAVLALFTWKGHSTKIQPQMAKQENAPKVIEKDHVDKSQTSQVNFANDTREVEQLHTRSLKTLQPKKKNRKAVRVEEPLITEAEPLPEESETEMQEEYLPTEPDPFLLAAAEAQDIRARGERLYQEVVQIINNH